MMVTNMEMETWNGEQIVARIRRKYQRLLLIGISVELAILVIGILLTIRFRMPGAVIGLLLLAATIPPLFSRVPKWLHPESADVFRKYGTPDAVAERLCQGGSEVFFDNGRLLVTEQYLLDREDPEMLLFYPNALTVYPDGVQGKDESLIVFDKWGQKLRFPFTNEQKQIVKIDILKDKVRKQSPNCRSGCHSADMEYVRQNQISLPSK